MGALLAATLAAYLLFTGTGSADPAPDAHTVAPGDTLWSIATEHYPLRKTRGRRSRPSAGRTA